MRGHSKNRNERATVLDGDQASEGNGFADLSAVKSCGFNLGELIGVD